MYAYQPRRSVRQAAQPVEYFFEPLPSHSASYRYQPDYAHLDDYQLGAVDEPTELDLLEYEEQQLLEEQARILAQRKRLAARKQHIQHEQALEQERIRQYKAQRYLEEQRRQQIAHQQRVEEARRHQLRQRQLASIKEAQLEAALRELEFSSTDHKRTASPCATHCHTSPQKVEASSVPSNPIEWILRALVPQAAAAASTSADTRRSAPAAQVKPTTTPTATKCAQRPFAQAQTKTAANSTSAPASSSAPTAPAAPVNPLAALKTRVGELGERVSNLLQTQFDSLTLRQFGKIDSDLMQALLALDNVEIANEAARTEKKELVNQTVSLLEKVDSYKDAYSRSSSEASDTSSHQSAAETAEALTDLIGAEQATSSESSNVESHVEHNSAVASSSEPSDSPAVLQTSEVAESHTQLVEEHAPEDAHPEPSVEVSKAQDDLDAGDVEWDDESQVNEDDVDANENEEPLLQAESSQEVEPEVAAPVTAPSGPQDDPFGFNQIHAISDNKQSADSIASTPIQIGNARKASVLIEAAAQ